MTCTWGVFGEEGKVSHPKKLGYSHSTQEWRISDKRIKRRIGPIEHLWKLDLPMEGMDRLFAFEQRESCFIQRPTKLELMRVVQVGAQLFG